MDSKNHPTRDHDAARSIASRFPNGCALGCMFSLAVIVISAVAAISIYDRPRVEWSRKNRLDEEHCKRVIESDLAFSHLSLQFVEASDTGRTFVGVTGKVATKEDLTRLKAAIGRAASLSETQVVRVTVEGDSPPAVPTTIAR